MSNKQSGRLGNKLKQVVNAALQDKKGTLPQIKTKK
jgi:hypothetical protein